MMHTIREQADWMYIPPEQHNWWQKLAVRTYGFITPGNIITALGLSLVVIGVIALNSEQYVLAGAAIALGRIFDLLDGIAAERTGTKSQVGEIVDTGADKIAILLCAYAVIAQDLAPLTVILAIASINIVNVGLSVVARMRKVALHPSRSGKLFTAFSWLSVVLYIYAHTSEKIIAVETNALALFSFVVCMVLGFYAIYNYTQKALEPTHE